MSRIFKDRLSIGVTAVADTLMIIWQLPTESM